MRPVHFILLTSFLFFSCKKDNLAGGKLEIYLLKSYQLVPGKCQVNGDSAVLEETALVNNDDILRYHKKEYQFTLTDSSMLKIKALMDRTPFALTVNRKVVYYGIVKPIYSSSTCFHSITMDYVFPNGKITMSLGYPGGGTNIDDQRNNPILLAALKSQGKLR